MKDKDLEGEEKLDLKELVVIFRGLLGKVLEAPNG